MNIKTDIVEYNFKIKVYKSCDTNTFSPYKCILAAMIRFILVHWKFTIEKSSYGQLYWQQSEQKWMINVIFVHIFLLNRYLDVLSLPPFIYSLFHSLKMHLRNVKALAGVLYWNYCQEVALCLSASLTSLLSSSERRREWQWMCLRQRLAFKKPLNYDRRKRDQSTRRTRQTVDYDKI